MLLNLVWDRANVSKTLERTFPKSTPIEKPRTEGKLRQGFFERFERLLTAYAKLILEEFEN